MRVAPRRRRDAVYCEGRCRAAHRSRRERNETAVVVSPLFGREEDRRQGGAFFDALDTRVVDVPVA
jgi:hypothetical protein